MKKKIFFAAFLIIGLTGAYTAWQLFGPTVSAPEGNYFYISTGSKYSDIKRSLIDQQIIGNTFFFDLAAKQLKYPAKVKAGKYRVKKGTSVFSLLRMLRSGSQTPVNLVINKLRLPEDLAQKIAAGFETDSASVMQVLTDAATLRKYEVDNNNLLTTVIPNTYSFYWNTPPGKILDKLYAEKVKFWNEERQAKAKALNLTPGQVYTLASIVEEETNKQDDKGKIASVYLNRIEKGMKLQADPTVKFALKDFALTRIMYGHLNNQSPYNTYQHEGLPPGPICTPSIKTIDAVLDAPQTNFIFFVAKPDFNGYSNFASSYAEHLVFAKAYQQALDSLIKAKANK
ncbi:MAG: endolytic transglycosylase MltG [Ferruginibacter sp.]